jgi:hypothetical protein
LVGSAGLLSEPRQDVAEVGVAEGRGAVDRAGEEALTDAELDQSRQDLSFGAVLVKQVDFLDAQPAQGIARMRAMPSCWPTAGP